MPQMGGYKCSHLYVENIAGIIWYCLKKSSTLLTVGNRVFITHGACYCSCASIEVVPFCS